MLMSTVQSLYTANYTQNTIQFTRNQLSHAVKVAPSLASFKYILKLIVLILHITLTL